MMKEQKGVTLVALVITIIVLLILAGVTIAFITGDNGLLKKAQDAGNTQKIAEQKENASLDLTAEYADYLESKYTTNASTPKTFLEYLNALADDDNSLAGSSSYDYKKDASAPTLTTKATNSEGKKEVGTIELTNGVPSLSWATEN